MPHGYGRGVGSKFGLVRQFLCQSSQHSVQLQSTLHANATGVLGACPPRKILKMDALRLNLVAHDSSVQCTVVYD